MNIARSLEKPVPRSKKRRRARRLKASFHFFVLLICLVSGGFALYWTVIGGGILWRLWGAPLYGQVSEWLFALSASERFMWLNRLGWGAVLLGMITAGYVCRRPSRLACWIAIGCFTYTYYFLAYVLWRVLHSFYEMSRWTENGLIGLAVLGFLCIISRTRMP